MPGSSPRPRHRATTVTHLPAADRAEREASLRQRGRALFSKGELLLLWAPQITLHADGSIESQRAFEALAAAELRFLVLPLQPGETLHATWYDFDFHGLTDIRDMAQRLHKFGVSFNASFERQMPASHQRTDPQVEKFMADLRAFQLEEAWAVLASLSPTAD